MPKKKAKIAKAAKSAKRSKGEPRRRPETVETIGLDFLDPEHFPDLEAVRRFVEGPGIETMILAITDVANPTDTSVQPPQDLVEAARKEIYFLGKDLATLIGAYVANRPVRAEEDAFYPRPGGDAVGRLMLFQPYVEKRRVEIARYLIGRPPASLFEERGERIRKAMAEVA